MTASGKRKFSTRFLKQYIVPADQHDFLCRLGSLCIVFYDFETYEEMAKWKDCHYLYALEGHFVSLERRVESLNLVGDMLWLKPEILKNYSLPVSRYQWLQITLDTFLMRLISISDCALLLTSRVYELDIDPRVCDIKTLKKNGVPRETLNALKAIINCRPHLRDERNHRFHRGHERVFSSDDKTFKTVSLHQHWGSGTVGRDRNDKKINTTRYLKEGLVGMQREFNASTRDLAKRLNHLYGILNSEFNHRFHEYFHDPINGYGRAQFKPDVYKKVYG